LQKENEELKKKIKPSFVKENGYKKKKRWMKLGRPVGHPGCTRSVPDHIDHVVEQTLDHCPDCGQIASSCPTGLSIIVILGGILAGLGVFYKKIGRFFGKIFKRGVAEMPRAAKRSRKWSFGWVLFLLTAIAIIEFGNYFPIKAAPKNTWQPLHRTSSMCPLRTKVSPVAATPISQTLEKIDPITTILGKNPEKELTGNPPKPDRMKTAAGTDAKEEKTLPIQASPEIIPESKPAEISPKPGRMRAVIHEDGSVEMQKEESGVVRYETAGFLELNDDIYDRLDLYEGKKSEITGYVYRRNDFQPNQFVVARGYVRCCLACGAVPVGPLCEWDRAPELANDTWVKVEGIITREYFKDDYYEEKGDIPLIKVEKVVRVSKPENPYVYARNPATLFGSPHRS
ncbi:MAG: TIGR03943 family protein, partial [Candidatus Omnitrophota bacterium]